MMRWVGLGVVLEKHEENVDSAKVLTAYDKASLQPPTQLVLRERST